MHNSDNVIAELRNSVGEFEFTGSLDESLAELSAMVAEALNARYCAITILSERRAAEIGLRPGPEVGDLPNTRTESVNIKGHQRGCSGSLANPHIHDATAPATSTLSGSDAHPRDKMFS